MSQYPPGPPPQYPSGGQPPGPPPTQQQPGWGQQPPGPPTQPGFPPQGPGGPQQPGWGQQPYSGAPSGGGGNGVKIIIGVLVVAVVGLGAFFLLGGEDGASASSPTDAVESYFDAIVDEDCERAIGLVTEDSWSQGGTVSREEALSNCSGDEGLGGFGGAQVDSVELMSEDGNNATVSAAMSMGSENTTLTVPLVKQGDDWKLDLSGISFGDASEDSDGSGTDPGEGGSDVEVPDITLPDGDTLPDITLPEDMELPEGFPEECDPSSDAYDLDACMENMPELPEMPDSGFGG